MCKYTVPSYSDDLRSVFAAFSSFGAREAAARDMDGAALIKMVRDAGLLGGGLTPTAVDLVFAKVRGGRTASSGAEKARRGIAAGRRSL